MNKLLEDLVKKFRLHCSSKEVSIKEDLPNCWHCLCFGAPHETLACATKRKLMIHDMTNLDMFNEMDGKVLNKMGPSLQY